MKTYRFYLDAGRHFLNKSFDLHDNEKEYHQLASILLFWIALESYVNTTSTSLAVSKRLKPHEKAFLGEKELKVDDYGNFHECLIRPSTTRKILFLINTFTKVNTKRFRNEQIWKDLMNFEEIRNMILHYKEHANVKINTKKALKFQELTEQTIKYLNSKIFNTKRR